MLDAYASLRHYAEHLAPIFAALPGHLRGTSYAPGRDSDTWGEHPPGRWPHDRLVLVASQSDVQAVAPRPCVYVEHGAGQSYGDGVPGYSGASGMERVRLFLCPNERVAGRWRAVYPGTPAVVVGCARLDRLRPASEGRDDDGRSRVESGPAVIAFTFHFECNVVPETRSAWPHYDAALPALVRLAQERGWRLLGHSHPRLGHKLIPRWRALGVETCQDPDEVLGRADVLCFDNTSLGFEAAALNIPLVVMDAPWYRRDVNHGMRFWEHADMGVRVSGPAGLPSAIHSALLDPPEVRERRRGAARAAYSHVDGRASGRAVQAIVDLVEA